MKATEAPKKIFYLCDGEDPTCRKRRCYKQGTGECMYTSNIEHARNFTRKKDAYWEWGM